MAIPQRDSAGRFVSLGAKIDGDASGLVGACGLSIRSLRDVRDAGNDLAHGLVSAFGAAIDSAVELGKLTAAAITTIAAAAAKCVAELGEFETAFTRAAILMDRTAGNAGKLAAGVRKLATAMGIEATEAAGALADAIGSGIAEEDALRFVEVAAKAAIAGSATLSDTVKVLAGVSAAFGLSASEATHIADVLFATTDKGVTTVGELATSLGNVGSLAAAAGLSFEETTAAVGALTRNMLTASEATTGVRAIIAEIISPSEKTAEALKKIGATAADLRAVGLEGIITRIRDAGLTTADGLATLFGRVEGASAAAFLAGKGFNIFAEALDTNRNAVGASERAYAAFAETVEQRFAVLTTTLKDMVLTIGEIVKPLAELLLGTFSEFAEKSRTELLAFRDLMRVAFVDTSKEAATEVKTTSGIITLALREIGDAVVFVADVIAASAPALAGLKVGFETAFHAAKVAIGAVIVVLAKIPEGIASIVAEFGNLLSEAGRLFNEVGLLSDESLAKLEQDAARYEAIATKIDKFSEELTESITDSAEKVKDFQENFNRTADGLEGFGKRVREAAEPMREWEERIRSASDAIRALEEGERAEAEARAYLDAAEARNIATQEKEAESLNNLWNASIAILEAEKARSAALDELWSKAIKVAQAEQDQAAAHDRAAAAVQRQAAAHRQAAREMIDANAQLRDSFRLIYQIDPAAEAAKAAAAELARQQRAAANARANSAGASLLGFQPSGARIGVSRNDSAGSGAFGLGSGRLLGFKDGGRVPRDGPALVHKGETVLTEQASNALGPAQLAMLMGSRPITVSPTINVGDTGGRDARALARELVPEITRAVRLGLGQTGAF